jgi:hypothetical protein
MVNYSDQCITFHLPFTIFSKRSLGKEIFYCRGIIPVISYSCQKIYFAPALLQSVIVKSPLSNWAGPQRQPLRRVAEPGRVAPTNSAASLTIVSQCLVAINQLYQASKLLTTNFNLAAQTKKGQPKGQPLFTEQFTYSDGIKSLMVVSSIPNTGF